MYEKYIKRLLDFIFSIVLLLILFPIMAIISACVLTKMGRPIFFKQKRPGKNKKIFILYKFRTMIQNKELSDEERITSFGHFLRKTSLDELPQIFNVLLGDMSFIGPRPLLIEYNDHYNEEQNKRFNVKPGISGLAQVKGRNTISWSDKFALDVYYVDNQSFKEDIKIFFLTIYVVLKSSGFNKSGEAKTFTDSIDD